MFNCLHMKFAGYQIFKNMKKYIMLTLLSLIPFFHSVSQEIATINDIKYYLLNGEATIMVQKESLSGKIVIPEYVYYSGEDYKVVNVANNAFKNTKISEIVLPNSITSIGDHCFFDCSNLALITLPDGITSLGESCFFGCSSLESITLPVGITSLGESCFSGCSLLSSITLPNGITSLGEYCFSGCVWLTSITLPYGIVSLGDFCFERCLMLSSITLPNSITSLGKYCFLSCYRLSSITLPEDITSLGESCFSGCSSLSSITLPEDITSLGESCFSGCSCLSSITMPNGITSLGESCFYGCSSLSSIVLPNSITSLGSYCFSDCSSLSFIALPNGITSLEDYCFRDCQSLSSITLPNSITSLGSYCFFRCSNLESITLPNGITSLGEFCFSECTSLSSITLPISITLLGSSCFANNSSLMTVTCQWKDLDNTYVGSDVFMGIFSEAQLYVPIGTSEKYKNKKPWSEFKYIIEDGGISVPLVQCEMPVINYSGNKLTFTSQTEGAEYHYTIANDDVRSDAYSEDGVITLSANYKISVYASADGCINSETATAKLYFIDAKLDDATDVLQIEKHRGVLISTEGNNISICGLDDNEKVYLYNLQGMSLAEATACAGTVRLNTTDRMDVVIVKIGNQSIKVRLE